MLYDKGDEGRGARARLTTSVCSTTGVGTVGLNRVFHLNGD